MKKPFPGPSPPDCDLDDDIGLLIGNRIHRMVGGQVIGQQNVSGDAMTVFGSEPKRLAAKKAGRHTRKPKGTRAR